MTFGLTLEEELEFLEKGLPSTTIRRACYEKRIAHLRQRIRQRKNCAEDRQRAVLRALAKSKANRNSTAESGIHRQEAQLEDLQQQASEFAFRYEEKRQELALLGDEKNEAFRAIASAEQKLRELNAAKNKTARLESSSNREVAAFDVYASGGT